MCTVYVHCLYAVLVRVNIKDALLIVCDRIQCVNHRICSPNDKCLTLSLTHSGCWTPMQKQAQNNKTFFGSLARLYLPKLHQRVKLHLFMKSMKGMIEWQKHEGRAALI